MTYLPKKNRTPLDKHIKLLIKSTISTAEVEDLSEAEVLSYIFLKLGKQYLDTRYDEVDGVLTVLGAMQLSKQEILAFSAKTLNKAKKTHGVV